MDFTHQESSKYIVIFDGVCNSCNGSVNFIIRRDTNKKFMFAPIQSNYAQNVIAQYGMTNVDLDTFLLIKNGTAYVRTNAALEITKDLDGYWYLLNIFRFIPRSIRDGLYHIFATNRYKLFGRSAQCIVPTDEIKERFLS